VGHEARRIGPAYNAARLQEIALAEQLLKTNYGSQGIRQYFAERLAKAYVRIRKPEKAAAILEKEAAELPRLCRDAAIISMREIDSLSLTPKFLECETHRSSSVADQRLEWLSLEYQWRNGDYPEAQYGFIHRVFGDRWRRIPDESPAVLDTIGNVRHTEGRSSHGIQDRSGSMYRIRYACSFFLPSSLEISLGMMRL
jgi:hypothetical protein